MGLRAKVVAATPLITVIIYLLLGFCADAWHPGWVVFLAIPIVPIILGTVTYGGTVSRFSRYSIFSDGTCLGNMASGMDYIFNNTSR